MRIAITGGAGFIGDWLVRRLRGHGHETVIIDLKKSPSFPNQSHMIDIADLGALTQAMAGCKAVYHLAAEHRDDVKPVEKYYDVNTRGTKNVVAAAEANNISTIVFTSTVAVYGLNAGESFETAKPKPFNDYGKSKLEAEQVLRLWAKGGPDRSLTIIRLVATFGADNRGNIHTLMKQIRDGKFVMIGDGTNKKSIAFVGNVAAFLDHCGNLPAGLRTYNYADKPDYSMSKLVNRIRAGLGLSCSGPRLPYFLGLAGGAAFDLAARITGKSFQVSIIRVKKFCADTVVNSDKMKETGFKPLYSLDDGLQQMMDADFRQKKAA